MNLLLLALLLNIGLQLFLRTVLAHILRVLVIIHLGIFITIVLLGVRVNATPSPFTWLLRHHLVLAIRNLFVLRTIA